MLSVVSHKQNGIRIITVCMTYKIFIGLLMNICFKHYVKSVSFLLICQNSERNFVFPLCWFDLIYIITFIWYYIFSVIKNLYNTFKGNLTKKRSPVPRCLSIIMKLSESKIFQLQWETIRPHCLLPHVLQD